MKGYIDASAMLDESTPVFLGDESLNLKSKSDEIFKISNMSLGCHLGTHIYAPSHLIYEKMSVCDIPIDTLIGESIILDFTLFDTCKNEEGKLPSLSAREVTKKLDSFDSFPAPRVFFKIGHSFSGLDTSVCELLIKNGVVLVGIDTMSIEENPEYPAHKALLSSQIPIIEGLCLNDISDGFYNVIALPMRLKNAEASPCRVVFVPI